MAGKGLDTMNRLLVVYSSATTATRLKMSLAKDGYDARVLQTPQALTSSGCGYSVGIYPSALGRLKALTYQMGVRFKGIYEVVGNEYRKIE